MSLRVSYTAALLSVMVAGCASVTSVDTTAVESPRIEAPADPVSATHKIIREPIQVTQCRRTQRDLSVDWLSRQYLCSHDERLAALQSYNDGGHLLHRRKVKPLLADDTVIDRATITPAMDVSPIPLKPSPAHEMVQYHVVSQPERQNTVQAQSSDKSSGIKSVVKIPFDDNKDLLNQEGINHSLSLIPAVNDARRVTLLGVYEQAEIDEVSKLDTDPQQRERFSVGRALSIRKLWQEEGVDLSKVMIMHHRDHREGRYVEIVLHD